MVLDHQTLRPFLGNRTGGLCGPAIKPIALRMVAEVAEALPGVPLVGMGGVVSGQDALEFIACGATAVAVGVGNFAGLEVPARIVAELREGLAARGLATPAAACGLALA
jgi:dihydroorotate dehydrogenase (NAD+) catalytic subunit